MKKIKKVTVLIFFLFSVNSMTAQSSDTLKRAMGFVAGIQNTYYGSPFSLGFCLQKNRNQVELNLIYASDGSYSDLYGLEFVYSYYPNKFKPFVWPRHIDFRIDNSIRYLFLDSPNLNSYFGIYTGAAVRFRIKKVIYLSMSVGMGFLHFFDDYHIPFQYDNNFKLSIMFNLDYFKWKKLH